MRSTWSHRCLSLFILSFVSPVITTQTAQAVAMVFQNGTAQFSQGGFSPDNAVDGILTPSAAFVHSVNEPESRTTPSMGS